MFPTCGATTILTSWLRNKTLSILGLKTTPLYIFVLPWLSCYERRQLMNARQTFLPKNQKRRPIHHPCSIFLRFLYSAKSATWSILPRSASCQIAAQPRAVVAPFVPSLVVCTRRAWRGIPSDPQTNLLIDRYSLPYKKRKDRLVKNNFETLFFDKLACIL